MNWENVTADVNLILTKHFTKGRQGRKINKIVIHYNAGDLTCEGCYSVWQTREASAHYQVESSGRIGQLVWDKDTAWHAGNWQANLTSIGIEHANKAGGYVTDKCLDAGAHLVAALCRHYGLGRPQWLVNVFPHRYFAPTSCPGRLYDEQRDAYMSRAGYWYDVMTGAKQLPAALKGYVDLDPSGWYISAVEKAVTKGYMTGSGNRWSPDASMSRAEAVSALYKLTGHKGGSSAPYWYSDAASWAKAKGILTGGRYEDPCARQELCAMLCRMEDGTNKGEPTGMPDWPSVAEWARPAVAWAVEQGLIGSTGHIRPNDAVTRAECAAMLSRL